MRVKKYRTTISIDERKFEHLEKIMKEKGFKSVSKAIEYLIDHHMNRLSNHIVRDLENMYLMKLIVEKNVPAKEYKNFIKKVYKNIDRLEMVKTEVLKELKSEKRKKKENSNNENKE